VKYFVVTPAYESGGSEYEPPDYGSDVAEIEAINRRLAKAVGLKALRKMNSRWVDDLGNNPFKGLKVYRA